jgi:LysR family transcriptional regulator, nitrogen assimilation regulatory protein
LSSSACIGAAAASIRPGSAFVARELVGKINWAVAQGRWPSAQIQGTHAAAENE